MYLEVMSPGSNNVAGVTVYSSSTQFGRGTGPILFTNIGCSGSESSLLECSRSVFGVTSCTHSGDVGVKCEGNNLKCQLILHIRAVAIKFGVWCICKHATARGVWGNAPAENFLNLEAMRLLLRPFLGQNDAFRRPDADRVLHA